MRNPPLILITDDDPDFLEILCAKLTRSGFLIAEAHDGREGIEKAANLKPDLMMMDISMPDMNGTEAVLELKKNPETKDIKVVFLTSLTDPWPGLKGEPHEKVAKDLGAIDFINKADDLDKIVDKIKTLLKQWWCDTNILMHTNDTNKILIGYSYDISIICINSYIGII